MTGNSIMSVSDLGSPYVSRGNINSARDSEQDDEEILESKKYKPIHLPKEIYKSFVNQFPPNPLLPKTFNAKDDSPRSGGMCKFLKLTKFRGMDNGYSKFR